MQDPWLNLLAVPLRPQRPLLAACLRAREAHLASRREAAEARASAIARCTARIDAARAEVFAANTGIVTARMTELEREWRTLSRPDLEGGLMDLWARIAPAAWIDQKRWRDSAPVARLEAAVALASDPEGVEVAEQSARALATALRAAGGDVSPRVRWQAFASDVTLAPLLDRALSRALHAFSTDTVRERVIARARVLEERVITAGNVAQPERPVLVQSLALAAFLDFVWRGTACPAEENPTTHLRAIWKTGYFVAAADENGVVLTFPEV